MMVKNATAIYEVSPPADRDHEAMTPYYKCAAEMFEKVYGSAPVRNTLWNYLNKFPGYPVARGGPYVKPPVFHMFKKPMTTREAMTRFFKVVAELEAERGIHDADLSALESSDDAGR